MTVTTVLGIAEVSAQTGLTADTLRWYEREGLIPRVERGPRGHRAYDEATVRMIGIILRLRRTGMPLAEIRTFVGLVQEGAASHGRRIVLLREHRERVLAKQRELAEDLAVLDDKIHHYADLIAAGQDCGGTPITDPVTINRQRDGSLR